MKKRRVGFQFLAKNNCPKCRKKYGERSIKIVFKDVVECSHCGFIYVMMSDSNLIAYS